MFELHVPLCKRECRLFTRLGRFGLNDLLKLTVLVDYLCPCMGDVKDDALPLPCG